MNELDSEIKILKTGAHNFEKQKSSSDTKKYAPELEHFQEPKG